MPLHSASTLLFFGPKFQYYANHSFFIAVDYWYGIFDTLCKCLYNVKLLVYWYI